MLGQISTYEERGIDLQRFTDGMIDILKDTVIWQNTHKSELMKVLTLEEAEEITETADSQSCMHVAESMLTAKERFKTATSAVSAFEVICLSLATGSRQPAAPVSQPVQHPVQRPAERVQPAEPERPVQRTAPTAPAYSEPAVTEPKPAEVRKEEPVQVMPVREAVTISQEKIIQLLVQCSKSHKVKDEAAFRDIRSTISLENRKYLAMLHDCVIGASGEDCIVMITKAQPIANRINDPAMNRELYEFTKTQMNIDKIIFAITDSDFREASAQFRILMRDNNLPEACKVEKYTEETEKEETPEDRVLALFGKENVEIIGG
jgi:DNA polymerase-3 subunit gamma/tau